MTSAYGPDYPIGNVPWPCAVDVEIAGGGRWVRANALAAQVGRRGPQVLISYGGHQMWVSTRRVRLPGSATSAADRTLEDGATRDATSRSPGQASPTN